MPFPNEHTARQAQPSKFKDFRRQHPTGFPEGIDVVWGIKDDGKTEPQSLRFDAGKWPPAKAKKWLEDHGFLVGNFEPATGVAKAGVWHVGAATDLPAEDNREWDGASAQESVFSWAGWPNAPDPTKARQAFLVYDASAPNLKGSYKLPIASEQGGKLVVNLHGVRAAASRIPQTDIPQSAQDQARAVVDHYLRPPAEKTEGEGPWQGEIEIAKVEPDQQVVYGWLYVCAKRDGTPVVDHSGETVQISEIEKAAIDYVLSSRRGGEMHQKTGVGRLVCSMVFTPEIKKALGIPAGVLPDGWFVGYKIDDPTTWERVKKGELRMLSIGGRAQRRVLG